MTIYSIQSRILTLEKFKESKIELYFVKVFTQMIISCNSFWHYFLPGKVLPWQLELESRKMHPNSDCMIILPIAKYWLLLISHNFNMLFFFNLLFL